VDYQAESLQDFTARFEGSAPHITLERGNEKVVLVADSLSGSLGRRGGTFELTLQQLKLSYPHVDLTGFLHVDGTQPLVQLQLEGVQTDAAAVRKVAVTVWPNDRVVNKIFEIVREGTVPHIRFTAQGPNSATSRSRRTSRFTGEWSRAGCTFPTWNWIFKTYTGT